MRVFINKRIKLKIENGIKILKVSYRFRSEDSIKDSILEKRLLSNVSTKNIELIIYNVIDLEEYYDRKSVNVCRIVKEVARVDRLVIKLFTKVISRFKYHICTNFRINDDFYRGYYELYRRLE